MGIAKNSIYNMDLLEGIDLVGNESVDLIVTDPPYKTTSRGGTGNSGGMCKKKEFSSGKVFKHNDIKFSDYLPELYRVLKSGCHCYIMCNHKNLIELLNESQKVGFHFIKSLIWNKGNKIMGQCYMSQFEYIIFLRKGKHKKINNCGTADILNVPNVKTKVDGVNIHDTEKPVELMKTLIENSSSEGDLVLEPFAGAGATCIASAELGRNFIAFEIDKKYSDIAWDRVKDKITIK